MRKVQKNQEFSDDSVLGGNINLIVKKMSLASEALDFYTEIEFNRIVFADEINLCISVNAENFLQIPKKIAIKILKTLNGLLIKLRFIKF